MRIEKKEECEKSTLDFKSYEQPLAMVSYLLHLCQTLSLVDGDWPEVFTKLQKAQKVWACISWILCREGADQRTSG